MVISSMTHPTCHPPSKYLRPVVRGQLFKIGYICILDILEAQSCVSHAHTDFWAYSLTKFQIGHISENKVRLCGKLYWPICPGNVLCFRVNFCRYLNSECYTSQKPTWGKQNDANPHQGWRNPTKCGCIIMIALTLLAKLNCRFAEHIFHIYFD